MPRAVCLIRPQPHYRRDAFVSGLQRAGFEIAPENPGRIDACDVLVIWNRYGYPGSEANRFEAAGARVIVAENGYIGHDGEGRSLYALAIGGHNGSGSWEVDSEDRWSLLNIPFADWVDRPSGYILVCGQRGIGVPEMASPPDWHYGITKRLAAISHRRVVIRLHPENRGGEEPPPLSLHLKGAYCVVVWSSSVAGKALAQGIPAFYCAPHHVLSGAMKQGIADIESPLRTDRWPHFERMAYAQWTVDEIASGKAFKCLLR